MASKIGYKRPPEKFRFKLGVSGNPRGRPKKIPDPLGEVIKNALDAPIQYQEQGRTKTATRNELGLRKLVEHAVGGDIAAAEQVLRVRAQAVRDGEAGVERTEVSGWLPPHPGQTAGQKPQEITQGRATTVRQHEAEHNVQPAKVEG